ncbi:KpsF/GutQ family sugar-phosphate isomerase [Dyadobacter fanqingshengii]|uniref:KpsF/GutQ family sugar-phosphate isomerase n=1 Tax=Dyadobacter fanqingshengii TaxID=2906443 RepID=A0A9X1TBU2_9BACT|nr:KpsF/GutQ family sugar-phosphate isomerase [Dyadobacter fanqingshengii]MCF0042364.1 KpsF/GutQ family sugar-phosphate isomerase [Dyadobacter fanqingshengii]USJ35110.1 KpsF/GutQ family sugar-phosphate isomerase [Dyadobacter fanqingshengii]
MKLIKNIQSIAKEVLRQEAEALHNLIGLIDEEFENCVYAIINCGGRVVVSGVGKSAIVGQKIVATLNSTGTPALFMHAADAIHGDLGMIQDNDVVIVISRSGDTAEIKVLVPLLKRTGVTMIAMVSNKDSYLAKNADHILHAYAPEEADPLNLAPTTSTSVTMALGDALAICLLEARGFTHDDFAKFHPGGALGKRLYLKICDIFPHNALPVVLEDAGLQEIILEMTSKRLGATAVNSAAGKMAGIITDGDLRRMLKQHDGGNILHLKARDIMTKSPISVSPDEYAVKALELMQTRSITQVVVVEDDAILGFVHLHDLLREGLV